MVGCVLRYDSKVARVSASGSHDGLMGPRWACVIDGFQKRGLKGAVVIVVVVFVDVFDAIGCCLSLIHI